MDGEYCRAPKYLTRVANIDRNSRLGCRRSAECAINSPTETIRTTASGLATVLSHRSKVLFTSGGCDCYVLHTLLFSCLELVHGSSGSLKGGCRLSPSGFRFSFLTRGSSHVFVLSDRRSRGPPCFRRVQRSRCVCPLQATSHLAMACCDRFRIHCRDDLDAG